MTATTGFGWLIEGGATASTWISCTYEGGNLGFKFKGPGDAMGLAFIGCYFEFVPGTLFDFSEAAAVWINWDANYFNFIGTVIDDGGDRGAASTSTLFGRMAESNKFANIGNSSGGILYPGTMKVAGTRNFIQFDGESAADVNLAPPPNWMVGKHTRRTQLRYWSADGVVDVRAVAVQEAGITPRRYGGDVGSPYPGTIPFSTIVLPSGASVTATITTQIKMQPNASVIHFVVAIADNVGPKKVAGTVYGEFVDQRQGGDRPVSVSTNSGGFLVLTIANINNGNGASFLTGTIFQQ